VAILVGVPAASADAETPPFEMVVTGIYQTTSDGKVEDEGVLRPEIFMNLPVPGVGGTLVGHFEANTTPRTDGVTTFVPDADTNAGTALNGHGHGRAQISELYYQFGNDTLTASVGLLDVKVFLDTSLFANNERTQFVNTSLVNNATIEFPDYTLGTALQTKGNGGIPSLTLVVGGSSGLGDNAGRTYPELFDLRSSGNGAFAAAELGWAVPGLSFDNDADRDDGAIRVGAWTNTADHTELSGTSTDEKNAGVYTSIDGKTLGTGWNLRAGFADKSVSPAAWFIGGALERPVADKWTLGVGLTHTGLSGDVGAGFDDTTEAEVYAKYDVVEHVSITPSVQWVKNPGFDDTGTVVDDSVWVFGIRLGLDI
jgi:carbohydrate-selective porin OprB